ncbi:DUF736 domain-containing protein [Blastomonas aquatica]|uniref:DUF736 domain-containing protein n=1 Tax=Blastomonas aquatica TaxID=1510276 RepID=A0ABQ1IYN5_9SPHN|nr:DUF736 domain-containing protein [Blastomonas aquatica]GGB55872.1 hypothetical protein GCM10010833_08220 [Blastomonas aquatica]
MIIGSFEFTQDGYSGSLHTLCLDAQITLVPTQLNESEHTPDWKVFRGSVDEGVEIGAGWNRTGKRAGSYVALQIDDPGFVQPLRAILVPAGADDSAWHLLWSRSKTRDPR